MVEINNNASPYPRRPLVLPPDHFYEIQLPPLAEGMVKGVRNIAMALDGKDDAKTVRSWFHVLETSTSIPSFKIGSRTCIRLSSVRAKIWLQEKRSFGTPERELLAKLHILLSAILPLLSAAPMKIDEREQVQLAHATAEITALIALFLRSEPSG